MDRRKDVCADVGRRRRAVSIKLAELLDENHD
jgi:hypothetical protein